MKIDSDAILHHCLPPRRRTLSSIWLSGIETLHRMLLSPKYRHLTSNTNSPRTRGFACVACREFFARHAQSRSSRLHTNSGLHLALNLLWRNASSKRFHTFPPVSSILFPAKLCLLISARTMMPFSRPVHLHRLPRTSISHQTQISRLGRPQKGRIGTILHQSEVS